MCGEPLRKNYFWSSRPADAVVMIGQKAEKITVVLLHDRAYIADFGVKFGTERVNFRADSEDFALKFRTQQIAHII